MSLIELVQEKNKLHEETAKLSKQCMIGHVSEAKKKEMREQIEKNNRRLMDLAEMIRIHNRRKIE